MDEWWEVRAFPFFQQHPGKRVVIVLAQCLVERVIGELGLNQNFAGDT